MILAFYRFFPLFISVLFFFSPGPVFAQESASAEIAILENSRYPVEILKLIRSAKKKILLCMSCAEYTGDSKDMTTCLLEAVTLAAKKGIWVEAILDKGDKNKTTNQIQATQNYLFQKGVRVFYDTDFHKTRNNFLIVDDFICVVGSTVWTDLSLSKTNELSLWIESKDFACILTKRFESLKK
jgi:phosphatidylserine/phosphatidylglycerophosphate/cardiolipin synthase-like enzyme